MRLGRSLVLTVRTGSLPQGRTRSARTPRRASCALPPARPLPLPPARGHGSAYPARRARSCPCAGRAFRTAGSTVRWWPRSRSSRTRRTGSRGRRWCRTAGEAWGTLRGRAGCSGGSGSGMRVALARVLPWDGGRAGWPRPSSRPRGGQGRTTCPNQVGTSEDGPCTRSSPHVLRHVSWRSCELREDLGSSCSAHRGLTELGRTNGGAQRTLGPQSLPVGHRDGGRVSLRTCLYPPGVTPDVGHEDASWQVHGWEQMSPLGQDTVSGEARPVWGRWSPRLLPSTVLGPGNRSANKFLIEKQRV